MILSGSLTTGSYNYFIQYNDNKNDFAIVLVSPYHEDDSLAFEMGSQLEHELLTTEYSISKNLDLGYVAGVLKRLKTSGKVSVYKDTSVIENMLAIINFAYNYSFAKSKITKKEDYYYLDSRIVQFAADDGVVRFEYSTTNGIYESLLLHYGDFKLQLHKAAKYLSVNSITLTEASTSLRKNVAINTIKVIDYQMLCDSLDMSWYRKDGVDQKNYKSIKTVNEFELQVITPIVQAALKAHTNGEVLDVTLDTETTGLNIYNLSADNPDKDHCVAIPMSWAEDTGVVIFTDMEFFSNVPNEYAGKRLFELFENYGGEREIEIFVEESAEDDLKDMDLFDSFEHEKSTAVQKRKVVICRDWFNLIGHNVIFDGKVMKDIGAPIYFNNDTMQMAFDLNPTLGKGTRALKALTRKLFGHETPELTDILGKGNEDKYRYLSVEEVAIIYGCADGDYTLKVFHALKSIMTKRMYHFYQMQDVPLLNILYHSEYYGMRAEEELLEKEALRSRENIRILKENIYQYVGAFVSVYKRRMFLEFSLKSGVLSQEEYDKEISSIKVDWNEPFIFELKASEIRKVLYDILKYPILGWTAGTKKLPKTDKYVIQKLCAKKRNSDDVHFTKLEKDILVYGADRLEYDELLKSGDSKKKKKAESMCLISADKFNACKYPLAIMLKKYAELNKEYTAYFAPMEQGNMEGKIFKNYSMTRIETRRIANPGQTMKGSLKALIRSYSDDYYVLDFDMSQIEYRIMLSLSKFMMMMDRMSDPENDYHTETASLINNIPAHKVDKKTRKSAKPVSFGVPYGLGIRSLCDKIFGSINDDNLVATRMLLYKWETANRPVMDFLNKARDNALIAREMSIELRNFMDAWKKDENGEYLRDVNGDKVPKPIGFSYNELGFYRCYDLSDIDLSEAGVKRRAAGQFTNEESKIRRPAGNYPIQCFAAEVFRIILIRFYNRCVKEGIADKIIWHMLIHDELLCSVHKSIHPFFMYKIVKESCMITMKGHTKYFVGIGVGSTWAEAKDDSREAPVYFVDRVIKRWDAGEFGSGPFWFDDPWEELIKEERTKYLGDRIWEVVHSIQPDVDNNPINVPVIMQHFDNYTVRSYVDIYKTNYVVDKSKFDSKERSDVDEYDNRVWVSKFETWAIERFGEGKPFYDYDGKLVVLRNRQNEIIAPPNESFDFVDYDELFGEPEGTYWSFDEEEANSAYDVEYVLYDASEEEESLDFDTSNKYAKNLAQMLKKEKMYKHIQIMNNSAVISVEMDMVKSIKDHLKDSIVKDGLTVLFKTKYGINRWVMIRTRTNFTELDQFIDTLYAAKDDLGYKPKNFKILNSVIIIHYNKADVSELEGRLSSWKNSTGEYLISVVKPSGASCNLGKYSGFTRKQLDALLSELI